MKKIITVILVIAVMVASIIGFVACQNDSLDGRYKNTDSEHYLIISGNTIKYFFKETLKEEGTFTRKGDKITTTLEEYKNIVVLDNGDLIISITTVGGEEATRTYKKVTK